MAGDTRTGFIGVDGVRYLVISRPLAEQDARLTAAEQDIAARLSRGDSLRAIGIARGCSVRTVANQVQSIYRKLGVNSREALVARLNGVSPAP